MARPGSSTASTASRSRRSTAGRRGCSSRTCTRLIPARAPIVWRAATLREVVEETSHAKTLVLDVDGWPGHVAGQHVDVCLTAEGGYQAERSYSIASAPEDPRLALTIERIDDGEVSPYTLTRGQPPGWTGFDRRVDADMLTAVGPIPAERPRIFVCGPTPFVEAAADLLVALGHPPGAIRAERFGPTAG